MRLRSAHPVLSTVAVIGLLAGAAACGGSDDASESDAGSEAENDTPSTESAAPESDPASDSDSGSDSGGSDAGAAPTIEELTALAEGVDVAGLEAGEVTAGALGDSVSVPYRADGVEAFVTLAACDPFRCWDLDGEVGADQEENLRSNLAPVHLDNPDLVFEYGNVEPVPGYEAFFMYSFSFVTEGGSKAATNAYRLMYHDGSTSITIVAGPEQGFLPDTAEEFLAEMDRPTGEAIAADVFAAYADSLEPVS